MHAFVQLQATLACCGQGTRDCRMDAAIQKNPGIAPSFNDGSLSLTNRLSVRHGVHMKEMAAYPMFMHRSNHSRTICKATNAARNKVNFSREELTAPQLEKWEEASKYLEGLGFSIEETDKILGKAFGWVHSPYWTEEMPQILPELEIVTTAMNVVKSFGLSDEQVAAVLKKFPELLGCSDTLETNVGLLDKEWGIKGNTLKNLIIRKPQVLGYNVDCKGDCVADCTRCWVRF